jgi:excisionase family DNA binding protein
MRFVAQVQSRPIAEPWVSVEDVSAYLGVAKDSVYRWIEAKDLPAHKISKLCKFKLLEVDDWVRADGANETATGVNPVRKGFARKTK